MIHFIIEGVLGAMVLWLMFLNTEEYKCDSHNQDYVKDVLCDLRNVTDQLKQRIITLEQYLGLEYKSECTEKLPRYIKKSK